jgi:hypothetical protein
MKVLQAGALLPLSSSAASIECLFSAAASSALAEIVIVLLLQLTS